MKRAIVVLLVAVFVPVTTDVRAATFTFKWTGIVERIVAGYYYDEPATLAGVNVGDSFVATVTYDTAAFGPGVNVSGDGLDYAAPAGLQMTYQFESGGVFTKDITDVRARKYVATTGWGYCQWNWDGGDFGGLLFQANDWSHTAFDPPVPESFDEMHTLFLNTLSMFEGGGRLEFPTGNPQTDIQVFFRDQAMSITSIDAEIAEILLFFDAAVDTGALESVGPGSSGANPATALRNMIVTAGELLAAGLYQDACMQLYDAYFRCDGLSSPGYAPDFVRGEAAAKLAAMIRATTGDLGCP
jgi:hypothetical protein